VAVGLAAVCGVAIGSGCGSQTVVTDTVTSTSVKTVSAPAAPTSSASVPSGPAMLGGTIQVAGDTGVKLRVTLIRVIPKASGGEFETPSAGMQFVAVEYRLRNVGTGTFSDSMDNDWAAVDAKGEQFDTTIVSGTSQCAVLDQVKLAPGDFRLGCTFFEVRKGASVSEVQFTPESGFGDSTAQWRTH
jgi:hypothetical protein